MTENEAIIELKAVTEEEFQTENQEEAYKLAIQALEEIQQYRAIGTVEELITTQIREKVLNAELQSYKAIGTIEEFKALKEKSVAEKPLLVPTDDSCLYQEYRCPSCNELLLYKFKPYRCKCGKVLDWRD